MGKLSSPPVEPAPYLAALGRGFISVPTAADSQTQCTATSETHSPPSYHFSSSSPKKQLPSDKKVQLPVPSLPSLQNHRNVSSLHFQPQISTPASSSSSMPLATTIPNPSPFARPDFPADYWTGDDISTINPSDSVSQIGVGGVGKRLGGPRPLPSSSNQSRDFSRPEAITEESEVEEVLQATHPLRSSQRLSPGIREVLPLGESQYNEEEAPQEFEHEQNFRGISGGGDEAPLVGGAAGIAGFEEELASRKGESESNVMPYKASGYTSVGAQDEEGEYSAYMRNPAMENMNQKFGPGSHQDSGSSRGFLTAPLSYVKSFRSSPSSRKKYNPESSLLETYPPTSSDPKPFTNFSQLYSDEDAASRIAPAPLLRRLFWDTTPTERRIWEHQRGMGIQRRPWVCWIFALAMSIVLVVELVKMRQETGSLIQTKPRFNVMIGPSGASLIHSGARFAGCMKFIPGVSDIDWICLNKTNSIELTASDASCTMADICGFGGFPPEHPNQYFRFFSAIFLHAGVVHLLLNMVAQTFSSAQIERQMGSPKFLLLYLLSGTFGFILGANFALVGQPSVGASGAIFGTHAAFLVDLIAHWSIEYRPKRKLAYLLLEIVVGLALGLVPGIDNFAHIGGFAVGLLTALALFPIIHQSNRHKYVFVAIRCLAIPTIVILFVVLIRNFYVGDPAKMCEWCRYLSCWPSAG